MPTPWQEYRIKTRENYLDIDLTEVGLTGGWIKLRKLGSYTIRELTELNDKWVKERIRYLASKVVDMVDKELKELADDPDAELIRAMGLLEGRGTPLSETADPSNVRKKLIAKYLINEGSILANGLLAGMDIEIIADWNLTHPETGADLPVPSKDLGVLEVLPLELLWYIKEKILALQQEMIPPKVRQMVSITL